MKKLVLLSVLLFSATVHAKEMSKFHSRADNGNETITLHKYDPQTDTYVYESHVFGPMGNQIGVVRGESGHFDNSGFQAGQTEIEYGDILLGGEDTEDLDATLRESVESSVDNYIIESKFGY